MHLHKYMHSTYTRVCMHNCYIVSCIAGGKFPTKYLQQWKFCQASGKGEWRETNAQIVVEYHVYSYVQVYANII